MKFNNTEELIEYVNAIGTDRLKQLEIMFTPIAVEEMVPTTEVPVTLNVYESAVSIQSLSDSPIIKAGMDDSLEENVLYVDGFDSIPFSCSTGKVSILGRTIFTNICENEEGPIIHLNVKLNEKLYHNIPFKLKTQGNDSDYIMLLNPKTLPTNE